MGPIIMWNESLFINEMFMEMFCLKTFTKDA